MKAPAKMIQRLWNDDERKPGDDFLRMVLRALSIPYAGVVFCRNMLFDRGVLRQKKLSCPVISVGNMTVGGTGKTPTVIAIARLLQQKNRHPAVLSRGYGGKSTQPVQVVSDGVHTLLSWHDAGDEPALIADSLPGIPVITGPGRYLTGKAAIEKFGADVLILDDALQHRQLHRDVDIVLIDGKRPLGNGFMLPRGPLREGLPSLRRANMLVRTGLSNDITPLPGGGFSLPSFRGVHKPEGIVSGKSGHVMPVVTLRGQKIMAFAGIGYPETFRKGLSGLGAEIVAYRDFPDHHPYSESDIDELRRLAAQSGATMLLTTEKDGVRLTDFPEFLAETSFLRISMEIDPLDQFTGLLLSHITVS